MGAIDNVVGKVVGGVNAVLPSKLNPGKIISGGFSLYKDWQTGRALSNFYNQQFDLLLNASDTRTAAIAGDNAMWAQRELFNLGLQTANDAVGLTSAIQARFPSSGMSGTEKAVTTGIGQGEKVIQQTIP